MIISGRPQPRLRGSGQEDGGGRATLIALAVACLALSPPPVCAQSQPPPLPAPLTLDTALQYAADNYPSLRAAVEELNAATAGVDLAHTTYLPRLDTVWQSNRGTVNNITGPLLPQSVLPAISGPPLAEAAGRSVWGSAAGALLSWEPFDFGLRSASVHEAQAAVVRARAGQGVTRLQVQHAVGAAFLAAVAARQVVLAAEADLARRDVLARAARALADAQLRPGAEAARAEAERAAALTRAIQARQAVVMSDATLARVLGAADVPRSIDTATLLGRMPGDTRQAPSSAMHPLLEAQEAAVDLARAHESVLAAAYRPRFFLQGAAYARGSGAESDGRLEGGADGLWLERVNWAAGVQVVFPVFEFAGIRARRETAAATARAAMARLDEDRLALTADQRSAEALVEAARDVARNTPIQLDAARESEAQARARFDAGLASIVEVADTQALLATAEYQDAAARVDVWRALLARAVARGAMDGFIAVVRGNE
jgi:outer membrane protein TolC